MDVVEVQAHVGGAAVRIAVRLRGREQPVHQAPHLLGRERRARLHRRVAGEGAREALDHAHRGVGALVRDAVEDVAEELRRALVAEARGDALDHHGGRAEQRDVPAELLEPRPELEEQLEAVAREVDEHREEELLGLPLLALEPRRRLLVEDALVRRVLVQDHEPAADRREDVGAVELP